VKLIRRIEKRDHHKFNHYIDKKINVKFVGGREVQRILKGFDPVVNLVLDETK
jgi:U6 snRNA-associated Sm-like protein LSm7